MSWTGKVFYVYEKTYDQTCDQSDRAVGKLQPLVLLGRDSDKQVQKGRCWSA